MSGNLCVGLLHRDRQKRGRRGTTDNTQGSAVPRPQLAAGTDFHHAANSHQDRISELDGASAWRDEGHSARLMDWHRRASAELADRYIACPGTAADLGNHRADLLRNELSNC